MFLIMLKAIFASVFVSFLSFLVVELSLSRGVLTLPQGKRLFIKDIIHYLVPPNGVPSSIAPSLARKERGVGTSDSHSSNGLKDAGGAPYPYATEAEPGNPTVVPTEILDQFHFTFLIRHPRYSIPSYYRCTVPPLNKVTEFYNFMPSEAGYDEVRRVFDYLRSVGQIGPKFATHDDDLAGLEPTEAVSNGTNKIEICVVDADDLLDNPKGIIEAYCKSVGIEYDEKMLNWDSPEDQKQAKEAFEKWPGFHDDAMNSADLKPRIHVSNSSSRFP